MRSRFALLALLLSIANLNVHAQGTTFTYQGRLLDSSGPANGPYDVQFTLFPTNIGGNQIGPVLTVYPVLSNGLMTVPLNFGPGAFTGGTNWLEIAVRPTGTFNFTTLAPRTQVTPTPYAITAENIVSGTYGNIFNFSNSANIFNGTHTGNGSALTSLNAGNISSGTLSDSRLSANVPLLNASQTFTGAMNTFGDITMNTSAYHHLTLTGGNSLGYLYGSYAGLGDGIHMGYNYYYDAAGTGHVINTGGGTSRISAGYGYISLFTGAVNTAPTAGLTVANTYVGINTTSPQFPLHVHGSAFIEGSVSLIDSSGYRWAEYVNSVGIGFQNIGTYNGAYISSTDGSYHTFSDVRLKRDITNLDHILDRLLRLRPVSYHFRSVTNAPLSLGLIAQEVEPLFPEVIGKGSNGMKTIAYGELVPVAIRSIQELNDKLESQLKQKESEIQDLKQSNERLSAQLSELQSAVKALQKNQN
jgi:hypothetical protein